MYKNMLLVLAVASLFTLTSLAAMGQQKVSTGPTVNTPAETASENAAPGTVEEDYQPGMIVTDDVSDSSCCDPCNPCDPCVSACDPCTTSCNPCSTPVVWIKKKGCRKRARWMNSGCDSWSYNSCGCNSYSPCNPCGSVVDSCSTSCCNPCQVSSCCSSSWNWSYGKGHCHRKHSRRAGGYYRYNVWNSSNNCGC